MERERERAGQGEEEKTREERGEIWPHYIALAELII